MIYAKARVRARKRWLFSQVARYDRFKGVELWKRLKFIRMTWRGVHGPWFNLSASRHRRLAGWPVRVWLRVCVCGLTYRAPWNLYIVVVWRPELAGRLDRARQARLALRGHTSLNYHTPGGWPPLLQPRLFAISFAINRGWQLLRSLFPIFRCLSSNPRNSNAVLRWNGRREE